MKQYVIYFVVLLMINTLNYANNAIKNIVLKHRLVGYASYYADKYEGRRTASGLIFKQKYNYAAHCTLPFFTKCIVSNHLNGKIARVIIVDRGPFNVFLWEQYGILQPHQNRIIDVSKGTAKMLGMVREGVVPITIYIVK